MATKKPRITVTLEPEHHEVLRRLTALQGGSMSGVISDLIGEIAPVLGRLCASLELAKQAQDGVKVNLRRVAEEAEQDMEPLLRMARDQFDLFANQVQRAVEAAGPQPVITGATGANEDVSGVTPAAPVAPRKPSRNKAKKRG